MNTDKTYAEKLASEYAVKEQSKVTALKKLDAKVKLPATIFTYTFGIFFTLVLGVGLCLAMNVIGNKDALSMTLGIIIGIVGILGVSINYPIYKRILASSKKKYASDVMKLAEEIIEEN